MGQSSMELKVGSMFVLDQNTGDWIKLSDKIVDITQTESKPQILATTVRNGVVAIYERLD